MDALEKAMNWLIVRGGRRRSSPSRACHRSSYTCDSYFDKGDAHANRREAPQSDVGNRQQGSADRVADL